MNWWWQRNFTSVLLLPLSCLYYLATALRRTLYRLGILKTYKAPVPVIIVGSIVTGGTGKTPFTIALVNALKHQGYKPGILTRGYKGRANTYPLIMQITTPVRECGDEAALLKKHTDCPVYVDPNRTRSLKAMLKNERIDIIVCDDGLQHYALARDIEIVLLDSERQLGNGWCLPSGPLREPLSRCHAADFIVCKGKPIAELSPWAFELEAQTLVNCKNSSIEKPLNHFENKSVDALAAIANPDSFFKSLESVGMQIKKHTFPDHFSLKKEHFEQFDQLPLVMTEKDAVKYRSNARDDWWYLAVNVKITDDFYTALCKLIRACPNTQGD